MTNQAFWDRHRKYLASPEWKSKRESALAYHGRVCAGCSTGLNLQVDHLTYRRHGTEDLNDLLILCASCHHRVTVARRAAGAKMGHGYVKVTEELFGILLPGRGGVDSGRWSVPDRPVKEKFPCQECGKGKIRPKKEGKYCVPCVRKIREARRALKAPCP